LSKVVGVRDYGVEVSAESPLPEAGIVLADDEKVAATSVRLVASRSVELSTEPLPLRVEALSDPTDELEVPLLVAKACLALGEVERARRVSQQLVYDSSLPPGLRAQAVELLELATAATRPAIERAGLHAIPSEAVEWHRSELVEHLSEPPSAGGDPARDPSWMRIAMTRMARELGQSYRLRRGAVLRADVMAIDAMQRHLVQRLEAAGGRIAAVAHEVMGHGALLSEIFARRLGARWLTVRSEKPVDWEMQIGPARLRPFDRVQRFLREAHRERDLVAVYVDLEDGARMDARRSR
jgi:hypothetical protein